jgi:hypothetical protein
MRRVLAALFCLACLSAQALTIRAHLEDAVKERMKDADSAKFRSERMYWSDDQAHPVMSLCGEVNAKNSYGGYTGFRGFISTGDGRIFFEDDTPSGWSAVWSSWCAKPV